MSTAPEALIDETISRMITEAKIPYARDVTTEVMTDQGPVTLHAFVFSESAQAVANATVGGPSAQPQVATQSFQSRVQPWLLACFGELIAGDKEERNHRFIEESIELVQALGCSASEVHQLVDYVYGRPVGDAPQEVGGVMVTLAALCLARGLDMHHAGEAELARIWTRVDQIRAKQAAKPKYSPLPEVQS